MILWGISIKNIEKDDYTIYDTNYVKMIKKIILLTKNL